MHAINELKATNKKRLVLRETVKKGTGPISAFQKYEVLCYQLIIVTAGRILDSRVVIWYG